MILDAQSPKCHMADCGPISHLSKRVMSTPNLSENQLCSTMHSFDTIKAPGLWHESPPLTSTQYATFALNNAVHYQGSDEHNDPGNAALGFDTDTDNLNHNLAGYWVPEPLLAGDPSEHDAFGVYDVTDRPPHTSISVSGPRHEDLDNCIATPPWSHNNIVSTTSPSQTPNSNDMSTDPHITLSPPSLLSCIFPPLPLHTDPPTATPSSRAIDPSSLPATDLYSPHFVRHDLTNTKHREGWCGYCQRWLALRESSYNYDKKFNHGICPGTGRMFTLPVEVRLRDVGTVGGGISGSEGSGDGSQISGNQGKAKCEALCRECKTWIKLGGRGGRGGRANSWWRHAFKVRMFFVICPFGGDEEGGEKKEAVMREM